MEQIYLWIVLIKTLYLLTLNCGFFNLIHKAFPLKIVKIILGKSADGWQKLVVYICIIED